MNAPGSDKVAPSSRISCCATQTCLSRSVGLAEIQQRAFLGLLKLLNLSNKAASQWGRLSGPDSLPPWFLTRRHEARDHNEAWIMQPHEWLWWDWISVQFQCWLSQFVIPNSRHFSKGGNIAEIWGNWGGSGRTTSRLAGRTYAIWELIPMDEVELICTALAIGPLGWHLSSTPEHLVSFVQETRYHTHSPHSRNK